MTSFEKIQADALRSEPGTDTPSPYIQTEDDSSAVREWLQILLKWKWVVLGAIAVSLIVGIIATLVITRMYSASVSLEIAREEANVVNIEGVEPQIGSLDQEFYQTQYGLLRSRSLADAVVRELNLDKSAPFFEMFDEADKAYDIANAPVTQRNRENELDVRLASEILLEHISVSPERASRLVALSFESPDPEFSARVANTWAEKFIESNLARRFDATAYAREFLEERLAQVRERLEDSERQAVSYAANNNLVTITSPSDQPGGADEQRSLITDNLLALNDRLSEARGERIRAESRYRNSGRADASSEILTNPAISMLRQRRAEAAAEYARLMTQFQPNYPPAQAVQAQIQQYDESIAREEQRVRNSLQNDFQEAASAEATLRQRVGSLEQDVIDQRRRGIQYNIFQREVDTNRQLYNALLQRYKEIGVAGGIGTNNVAIVDRAIPPEKPSQPRPLLNLLIALLAGTALGIMLALVLDQIDEAITDPSQLGKDLKLPSLGTVPQAEEGDPLLELEDRKSHLSEAYLSVETALRFSTPDGLPRSLLVTSTQPGEGKSTTSVALATTLARLGNQTLLIDADMRSPSVNGLFELGNERGLSDVLSGNGDLGSIVVESHTPNLTLLTAGQMPPNAAELLSGNSFEAMIRDALKIYDVVLVDAPPVMGLADAPLIASKVEGTIMVIEANRTRARQAALALKRLRGSRAHLLGGVLTKFEAKKAHYGYGYDYGYGYGEKDRSTQVQHV